MKKYVKSLLTLLLGCLLACFLGVPVHASEVDTNVIDIDAKCKITVVLRNPQTNKPIEGIALTLYKVGEVSGDNTEGIVVVVCDDPDTEIPLSDIYYKLTDKRAAKLESYVKANNVDEAASGKTGSDGLAVFENLEVGLYLVVQIDGKESYLMSPFLVMVPVQQGEDMFYDYNIIAKPKIAKVNRPNTPEKPLNPEGSEDLEDSEYSEYSIDPYNLIYQQESGNPVIDSVLPQTGQLWWPVTVMSVAGLLCCGAGYWLKRSSNRSAHRE